MERKTIEEAAKGNTRAFKKIFDYYLPKLRPVALRYAYTDFEADDILQESFIKIYHHLAEFKHEGSFEGWIRRIIVNTAINHYKKNIHHYENEPIEEVRENPDDAEFIDFIEESEPSALMKLINELPEGYKIVFNMYVFEDLSHKEIGEMLNITDGTSRSQFSKAKKLIKKLISRQQTDQKSALFREGKQNGK